MALENSKRTEIKGGNQFLTSKQNKKAKQNSNNTQEEYIIKQKEIFLPIFSMNLWHKRE